MKILLAAVLLALATVAGAQSTPAKKELAAKILQLQQSGIEAVARRLAEQPAALMMQRAGSLMQTRIPPDKREPIAKDIQADVKKYVDETVPLLRERAGRFAPSTIGALLEERFTEDELKQIIAFMESPVNRRFLQMGAEMEKSLADKLVAETKGIMEPKIKGLELAIAGRLGIPATPAASAPAASARPPAKAASN